MWPSSSYNQTKTEQSMDQMKNEMDLNARAASFDIAADYDDGGLLSNQTDFNERRFFIHPSSLSY